MFNFDDDWLFRFLIDALIINLALSLSFSFLGIRYILLIYTATILMSFVWSTIERIFCLNVLISKIFSPVYLYFLAVHLLLNIDSGQIIIPRLYPLRILRSINYLLTLCHRILNNKWRLTLNIFNHSVFIYLGNCIVVDSVEILLVSLEFAV